MEQMKDILTEISDSIHKLRKELSQKIEHINRQPLTQIDQSKSLLLYYFNKDMDMNKNNCIELTDPKKLESDAKQFYQKFHDQYGNKLKSKSDIKSLLEFEGYNQSKNNLNRVVNLIRLMFVDQVEPEKITA